MKWLNLFDERQQKEIKLCILYARDFAHGTDGHNAKMIIAKMADTLEKVENALLNDNWDEEIAAETRKVLGLE